MKLINRVSLVNLKLEKPLVKSLRGMLRKTPNNIANRKGTTK